eukprot:scaffold421342_cov60-Attheya_sp.AAC.1
MYRASRRITRPHAHGRHPSHHLESLQACNLGWGPNVCKPNSILHDYFPSSLLWHCREYCQPDEEDSASIRQA